MIKERMPRERKRSINLSGPEGNAFILMGIAKKLATQLDLDDEAILEKMKSSNYENLIQVFDSYFGDYVDLYRE